jgi:uncharacterized protein (DUF849 family)
LRVNATGVDRSKLPNAHDANIQDFMAKRGWFADPLTQPRWDIPDDVVVKVAVSGRSAVGEEQRKAGTQFPMTIESFREAARESILAGAAGVHVDLGNIFTEQGEPIDAATSTYDVYRRILDPLRDEFGDTFVVDCNVLRGASFEESMKPVVTGLADMAPVSAGYNREWTTESVKVLQEHGCKPEVVIHGTGEVGLAKMRLIDTGILEKPYTFIVLIGTPVDTALSPFSPCYLPNTADMARTLILIVDQLRTIDPDSVIMVCAAGRASLYLSALALMLGVHIRVGTEDTVWTHPHRDDLLKGNREAVETAMSLSRILGRTPRDGLRYRELIGIGSALQRTQSA